eukprot:545941_1
MMVLLVLFCMFITNFSSSCSSNTLNKKKIFYDTDFGVDVDDTLALLLLLSSFETIDIIGINTLGRGYESLLAARMVKKYITLLGFGHIPVFVGSNKTFTDKIQFPKWDHVGQEVIYEQEYKYWDKYLIFENPSVELYNSADYVIAVGPLTNLANLFQLNDKYHIKSLILMGGSLLNDIYEQYKIDMVSLQKDFNFRIDPDAVIKVLSSNDRIDNIAMITGNITLQCWMNYHDLLKMKYLAKYQVPAIKLMVNQIEIWSDIQKRLFIDPLSDDNVAFLHDPLAVSYVFSEDVWSKFLTMENMEIGFAKNKNNVLHTINMNDLSINWNDDKNERILFTRNIMVSIRQNCENFRNFYFNAIVDFQYPQLSTNMCF